MGLMALTLERSKAAPLQLKLDSRFSDPETFCDLITPYIQNVETLDFEELTVIEDFTQVLLYLPYSTPNLRSLKLELEDDRPEWDPSIDPFESFPNTLRSLTLSDIPLYPSFLEIRTLTELSLHYYTVKPPLDALLDCLEGNPSLKSVNLEIGFEEYPAHVSRRRAVVLDQLRHLSIICWDAMTARTVISSIPLQRGTHLDITFPDEDTGLGLNETLSGISATHLSNLPSPTFMTYRSSIREIHLAGPNGSFSYTLEWPPAPPFAEFSVLPLTDIKELHLVHNDPSVVFHPSSFPALETLTIECNTDVSHLFSALFPDPSLFPSLRTLKFLDCVITEEFMEELNQFASSRKNTTSARLYCVEFAHRGGEFSTFLQLTD